MPIFKRGENYFVDYRAGGRRFREKVGPSLKLARQVEIQRKAAIIEGRFCPPRARNCIGFSEMVDLYWDLHARHKPSGPVVFYGLRQLKSAFKDIPLNRISIPDIMRYLNAVRERSTAATANRHHNILRAIFNRAIDWDKFDSRNPAAKVKQFRTDNSRTRFLEKPEIARLLAACDPLIHPVTLCALMTGMRLGEILSLRWEHVDLANKIIHVLQTKSGKAREIPLAPQLEAVLRGIQKGDGGPIFTLSARMLHIRFSKALMLAGIEDFRFHDLRHTFASHYIMRTNDLPTTQKLLGHQSPRMTQRYAHLSQGHLQVGMQLFSSGMIEVTAPGNLPPGATSTLLVKPGMMMGSIDKS